MRETIGARSEEDESYWTVIVLMVTCTTGLIICTFTEWLLYFFYNKKVNNWPIYRSQRGVFIYLNRTSY